MGLYLHAAWLKRSPEMQDALEFWMDEILATYNDVYFVTMNDALKWMQQPVATRYVEFRQEWRDGLIDGLVYLSASFHKGSPDHSLQK